MRICELHQKYPGQHFPNCKCDTEHEGAVFCAFHKKYPNQWLASCDCGVEEKKLRLKGHKFPESIHIEGNTVGDDQFVDGLVEKIKAAADRIKCEETTKAGNPCKKWAITGSKFCKAHQPK